MSPENAFHPGTSVRLKSDPGKQGTITSREPRERAGTTMYQVRFPDGVSWQPQYELEVLSDDNSDWTSLLEAGRYGRVGDLRRNLTFIHLSGRLANLVYSMDSTNTDFYAYQFKPVLSFLDSPSNGLLIADEVGLGKTIEAGLIWTELRARYDARRLLVVCPAMLREKWCSELSDRFGVDAQIMDAGELAGHLKKNKHELPDGKGIVCSLQGLRPPKRWEKEDTKASGARDLARLLDQSAEEESLVDLVIVDEAHYLRNPESQSAKLGQLLREVTENIVLLSATPINLRDEDLYHLLNLVDPDSFGVKEVFPHVLRANEPLIRARELALDTRASLDDIRSALEEAQNHPILANSHQLDDILESELDDLDISEKAQRIYLANQIERVNLLKHAVTRTRKSEVTEWRVIREPLKLFVELDSEGPEWNFYQNVTEAIREYAYENDINDGFLLAGPQRQVSSCMYAAAKTWQDRIESYEEQLYEDFGVEVDEEIDLSPMMDHLRRTVMTEVDLNSLRANDSKYQYFRRSILDYLDQNTDEKVVVFSFFRNTLRYLQERLEEDGIRSQVLMGGMTESKHEVIGRFKASKDIRVLLSSEVASEGVDLQFCRVLVNYDLPWNPMKVEQRIGRIDRIGQKAEKINIINIMFSNTIDHRIHERLYERLNIFERALGGMESILGEEIGKLTSDLLSRPLTESEEQKRIEQTSMAIERIRKDQEELEEQASHLIAHGSYILDEVNAAHQFKKRITDEDLVIYVKDYLDKYAHGYVFMQKSKDALQFNIRLPGDTAAKLDDFIQKKKLFGQTRLATGDETSCLFVNKVKDPYQQLETISQFHPLVRFISSEYREKNEAFYPLVALDLSAQTTTQAAGTYAFVVKRWEFSGIKMEEELPVRAICMDTQEEMSQEASWELLNQARVEGKDWLSAANEVEVDVIEIALEQCETLLLKDYERVKRQRDNENRDRVSFQKQSAQRHRDRQLKSRHEALDKLKASGKTHMIPAAEGLIRSIEQRFDVQVRKLDTKLELGSSQHDVCSGILTVK